MLISIEIVNSYNVIKINQIDKTNPYLSLALINTLTHSGFNSFITFKHF